MCQFFGKFAWCFWSWYMAPCSLIVTPSVHRCMVYSRGRGSKQPMSAARLECWSLVKVCVGPPNSLSMLIEWEMTSTSSDTQHIWIYNAHYVFIFIVIYIYYIVYTKYNSFYRIQYILSYYIKYTVIKDDLRNPTIPWMLPRATMLSVLARHPCVTCWKEWFCWAWVRLRSDNNPLPLHICVQYSFFFCL